MNEKLENREALLVFSLLGSIQYVCAFGGGRFFVDFGFVFTIFWGKFHISL